MIARDLVNNGLYQIHEAGRDVVVKFDMFSNSFSSNHYKYAFVLINDEVYAHDSADDVNYLVREIPVTEEMLKMNDFITDHDELNFNFCFDDGDKIIGISFPNETDYGIVYVDNLRNKNISYDFSGTLYLHQICALTEFCNVTDFIENFKL